ncbi:MAG: hypothetical protein QUS08_00270 [Methanothrix sp.]|nr:hypothetical protein [Methanothrix sp.]
MREIFIALLLILALLAPSLALTDYQRGVLDGLNRGWFMAQRYDQALSGDPAAYNRAVPEYNAWIQSIFGWNETLMLKNVTAPIQTPYSISRTFTPIHAIDASWNQTERGGMPEPDASGRIAGYPAETYYSIGPALGSL